MAGMIDSSDSTNMRCGWSNLDSDCALGSASIGAGMAIAIESSSLSHASFGSSRRRGPCLILQILIPHTTTNP